jgi:hypothetical protein
MKRDLTPKPAMRVLIELLLKIREVFTTADPKHTADVLGFYEGSIYASNGIAATRVRAEYHAHLEGLTLPGWILDAPDAEYAQLYVSVARPGYVRISSDRYAIDAESGHTLQGILKLIAGPHVNPLIGFSGSLKRFAREIGKLPVDEYLLPRVTLARLADELQASALNTPERPAVAHKKTVDARALLRALRGACAPASDCFFEVYAGYTAEDLIHARVLDRDDERIVIGEVWIMPVRS